MKSSPITPDPDDPEGRAGRDAADPAARRQVIWTPPDALRILAVLGSHVWAIVLVPILAILATAAYILITSPTYRIDAQLLLRPGSELTTPATVSVQNNSLIASGYARPEDVVGETRLMMDPSILHETVTSLGRDFFLAEPVPVTLLQKIKQFVKRAVTRTKDAIRAGMAKIGLLPDLSKMDRVEIFLQRSLEIAQVTRTDVIEVTLAFPDPEAGVQVLRRFLDIYAKRREGVYLDHRMLDYFTAETERQTADLDAAERDYAAARARMATWSPAEQMSLVVTQREALQRDIEEGRAKASTLAASLAEIDRQLADLPPTIPSSIAEGANPVRGQLELRRADLEVKLEAEQKLQGVRSVGADSLKQQIARLDAIIATQPERSQGDSVRVLNPLQASLSEARSDTEVALAAQKAQIDVQTKSLADLDVRLAQMNDAATELRQMERNIDNLRANQKRYLQARDEARIAAQIARARISNLVEVQKPQAGIAPEKPRVFRLMLMVAFGVAILTMCWFIMMDALRPRLHGDADIAELVPPGTIVRAMPDAGRLK